MAAPLRRVLIFLSFLLIFTVVLLLTSHWWLTALANALVEDGGAVKADMAVVLAGDYTGIRILRGAELVKQGMVPAVLVSGPKDFYGFYECELAIGFAVKKGYPAESMIPFPIDALSTREEAKLVIGELERRGVKKFLLVTSDYHTARAARIFRAEAKQRHSAIEIHPVAAYHKGRNAGNWWQTREGQKTVFFESVKTVATAIGM